MSVARVKIEFYYDCLSPFSYFAFRTLDRYREIWKNVDVELKPLLLGGVMASTKNLPPMARPWSQAAAKVSAQDMQRNKEYFNVCMLDMPANFFGPKGPADPSGLARDFRYQRTLTAVRRLHPEALWNVTRSLFDHMWSRKGARDDSGNVAMDETVLEGLCQEGGLPLADAARCVSELSSVETKALLKATIEEAVRRGAIGAPFLAVTGVPGREEMVFFGSDRFEQLAFVTGLPWLGPDPSRPTSRL